MNDARVYAKIQALAEKRIEETFSEDNLAALVDAKVSKVLNNLTDGLTAKLLDMLGLTRSNCGTHWELSPFSNRSPIEEALKEATRVAAEQIITQLGEDGSGAELSAVSLRGIRKHYRAELKRCALIAAERAAEARGEKMIKDMLEINMEDN